MTSAPRDLEKRFRPTRGSCGGLNWNTGRFGLTFGVLDGIVCPFANFELPWLSHGRLIFLVAMRLRSRELKMAYCHDGDSSEDKLEESPDYSAKNAPPHPDIIKLLNQCPEDEPRKYIVVHFVRHAEVDCFNTPFSINPRTSY